MSDNAQELVVNKAFSLQSSSFDAIDESNELILWIRNRVRNEVLQYIPQSAEMLELNCGTGIDAIFFAQKGYKVLATDNAEGMLATLEEKTKHLHLQDNLSFKRCSFNNLEDLGFEKQYDYVFSNFGGLNCTDNLAKVLHDVDKLIKPGGYFSLVIMPVVCPWEMITVFKGYFKTAFRRFAKNGTMAHLEGEWFKCYYYNPSYVIKELKDTFKLVSLKGLSIVVPPPFIEGFVKKHPLLFSKLEKIENKIWDKPPFNRWCDHFIITMQKL
jgi:ubiquinone/menaquinone biosynthesis C-methylase UbiE